MQNAATLNQFYFVYIYAPLVLPFRRGSVYDKRVNHVVYMKQEPCFYLFERHLQSNVTVPSQNCFPTEISIDDRRLNEVTILLLLLEDSSQDNHDVFIYNRR